MKILFVHNNFPSQFKSLAPALMRQGFQVDSLSLAKPHCTGINAHLYQPTRSSCSGIHPWLSDFETKIIRGEACLRSALALKNSGYSPDCIVAHPGWGESIFLKDVWPETKLGIYCEFYYHHENYDVGFEAGYANTNETEISKFRLKNLNNDLNIAIADAGISPTNWQASSFPEAFRNKITVVHDGVDTNLVAPNPSVKLSLSNGVVLDQKDEIVTFVNRNLEPYRGYPTFMRSLPYLLKIRPSLKVLIVGGDGLSYGASHPDAVNWKMALVNEIYPQLNDQQKQRIFFLGNIPYDSYLSLLRISTVHVYLTYPFVLGWSMLEAMSAGCCVVASATPPVQEVIEHNKNGVLVDFFDPKELSNQIDALLGDKHLRTQLGLNARQTIIDSYDLNTVCLPRQLEWVHNLASL